MSWTGLDVGGANLKIAWPPETKRNASEYPFPMWREKDRLISDLTRWMEETPPDCRVAATMTGELADCFASKPEGVAFIVDAVCQAARERTVRFYRTDGTWCDAQDAVAEPHLVAASNWHALATYSGRFLPGGNGYLIDIGSTTTDIIPIVNQLPVVQRQTDYDRLRNSQLLYTGVGRSSLSGILSSVTLAGQQVRLANEQFATIRDAYLWLGLISEQPDSFNTADGRTATKANAGQRLARMLCCDASELGEDALDLLAAAASHQNATQIGNAIKAVTACGPATSGPLNFIVSGSGSWLATSVLDVLFENASANVTLLADQIGQAASIAAAAHAAGILAEESHAQKAMIPR